MKKALATVLLASLAPASLAGGLLFAGIAAAEEPVVDVPGVGFINADGDPLAPSGHIIAQGTADPIDGYVGLDSKNADTFVYGCGTYEGQPNGEPALPTGTPC